MSTAPDFGTLDVTDFTVGAMLRAGVAIRQTVRDAASLEEAADAIVHDLYERCVDAAGERACAMVRFYKTHRYDGLEPKQQQFARAGLPDDAEPDGDLRCLALVASVGDEPEWNSRHSSRGHVAIPLPSAEIVRRAPMIAGLIDELGLDIDAVVRGATAPPRSEARTYDVFHVEQALGSPHIPAQDDFVLPHRIASVVGFGGLLRTGELYAVILFSRAPIPAASAARFRTIALDVRSALYRIDEDQTWRASS